MYQLDSFLLHHIRFFFFFLLLLQWDHVAEKGLMRCKSVERSAPNLHTFFRLPLSVLPRLCVHVCSAYQWSCQTPSLIKTHSPRVVTASTAASFLFSFFCFSSAFIHIDFAEEPGLLTRAMQLSNSHWIIRQRQKHTNSCIHFFSFQSYSCQCLHWIINQYHADKKFILLFRIGFFPPTSSLWRQCVNHYRSEDRERERVGRRGLG